MKGGTTDGVVAGGVVSFRLAADPYVTPATQIEAAALATAVARNELLSGLALSADGMAVSILLPLETKGAADDVADHVRDVVSADPTLAAADLLGRHRRRGSRRKVTTTQIPPAARSSSSANRARSRSSGRRVSRTVRGRIMPSDRDSRP